jgi:serine/threonine protein phosphatase PrpC
LASRVYYVSKKGLKQCPNQDDFFFLIDESTIVVGVLDGHGVFGHFCSNFIQTLLPKLLLSNENYNSNLKLALHQVFLQVNDAIYLSCEKTVLSLAEKILMHLERDYLHGGSH